ncbi:MAG: hypothetical protein RLN81_06735 [Balneolaceae bacterium]
MSSILKTLLLNLIILSFGTTLLMAQDSLVVDTTSQIDIRLPSPILIEDFANDQDFQYQSVAQNPDSFIDRLVFQLFRLLNFLFGNPIGNFILKAVLVITIASLVLVLINQLSGGNLINVFTKKNPDSSFDLQISEEEIDNLDLQKLLDEALSSSNYAAATRYIYLIALKTLNEQNLITWGIEKTNYDYETELAGHPGSPLFNSLTSYYEFVEYGDFQIDKKGFETVQQLFKELKERLEL